MSEEYDQILEVPIEEAEPEQVERLVHEPFITPCKDRHYFVREDAEHAKCRRCGVGYMINPTDRIDDGQLIHIY